MIMYTIHSNTNHPNHPWIMGIFSWLNITTYGYLIPTPTYTYDGWIQDDIGLLSIPKNPIVLIQHEAPNNQPQRTIEKQQELGQLNTRPPQLGIPPSSSESDSLLIHIAPQPSLS